MTSDKNLTKQFFVLFGDACFIVLSTYLATFIRGQSFVPVLQKYTGATAFYVAVFLTSFYLFDLYNLKYRFKSSFFLARFLLAVLAATLLIAMIFYLFPSWKIGSRGIFLIEILLIALFVFAWRVFFDEFFALPTRSQKTIIVGSGVAGETICDAICRSREFSVYGFLDDDTAQEKEYIAHYPIFGKTDFLETLVKRREIDAIVVTVKNESKPGLLRSIIEAKINGIEIYNMASLYEELTGKLPVLHLTQGWMAYTPFHGMKKSIYNSHAKGLIDLALSLIGLVITLPLAAIIGVAIKLDSRGPVFFRQKRVGLNDGVFNVIKFRSMVLEAESNGAVWASENDSRVTRVGKFLRKTRMDEIPQMWNVLNGQMSFIGPRPERPEFVDKLKEEIPFYSFRHAVLPGITGWAQVNYRYGASEKDALEKLQYDLFYIKNLSPFLDLSILLRTIRVVLFGKGAR